MALTYDLREVADTVKDRYRAEDISEAEKDSAWARTQSVIFSGLLTGIGRLTESNWAEAWARYSTLTPGFLTAQDFRDHIGMHTNVADETRAAWRKRIDRHLDLAAQDAKRDTTDPKGN